MVSVAYSAAMAHRDDQQIYARYALTHPHAVSLDLDHRLFLTGFVVSAHHA
jgi:hypothetical protein